MTKKLRRPAARRLKPIPKGRRTDVRREEFDHLIDVLNKRGEVVNAILRTQEIQFQRIAEMQAELDIIRRALDRITT